MPKPPPTKLKDMMKKEQTHKVLLLILFARICIITDVFYPMKRGMTMFDLHHIKGNTYYYKAYTNVGVYLLENNEVILIDACDHKRMVRGLDRLITENGWTVKTIIDTHCHVDHICGNRYFYDKYNCRILSTKMEQGFISYPDLEPKFYYSGIDTDKTKNPFFLVEPSDSEIITAENTPDGFKIIPLPGHSFEMIGVRTPDNVVFLADAVLSQKTVDEYKLPFFYNVNESIETLHNIIDMKADWFVPSHSEVTTEIAPLCEHNIKAMKNIKELVYEICEGRSFDDMFCVLMDKLELTIKSEKYPMYSNMLRNYLQSLVEDERIYARLDGARFIYAHR